MPVRIVELEGSTAVGEVGGVRREVSVMMCPDAKVGDYVIVHAGFAIQRLDPQEAEENLGIFREMARRDEDARRRARHRSGD